MLVLLAEELLHIARRDDLGAKAFGLPGLVDDEVPRVETYGLAEPVVLVAGALHFVPRVGSLDRS